MTVLIGCVLHLSPLAQGGDAEMTDRYSLTGIPQLKTPPTIDGEVGKREWYGAALPPRMISTDEGGIAEQRSRVFVAYDAQNLYVAFQFDRPVNVSKFDSMVIERQRVRATVNLDGISPAHTSDGEPHMRLRRA